MGGPTPPYARAAADISDSSDSGRSVLTGTAAQGATALGLGTGSSPTLAGLTVSGTAAANTVGANSFQMVGATILQDFGSGYRGFVIGGIQAFIAKDAADDPTNYYSNSSHNFRSRNYSSTFATISANGLVSNVPVRPPSYTVAALPAGTAGAIVYASNARKVGEAASAGTGVIAYYSNGAWRRLSDDTAVAQ